MCRIYSTVMFCCSLILHLSLSDGISIHEEFSAIYRKMADLEKEVRHLRDENHGVKITLARAFQKNQKLEKDISTVRLKSDNLEAEVEKQKKKNDFLEEVVKVLTIPSDRTKEASDHMKSALLGNVTYNGLGVRGNIGKVEISRVRRLLVNSASTTTASPSQVHTSQSNNKIAFLAYNPSHQQNLGIHQTVEFPTALTNLGYAYNNASSIFRAPEDGLYFFSATILSFPGEDLDTEIVHNGNGVVYTYSGGESMFGSGSTSAVIQLKAYDDVWVRILDVRSVNSGNVRVFSDKWSSFCGYRIA